MALLINMYILCNLTSLKSLDISANELYDLPYLAFKPGNQDLYSNNPNTNNSSYQMSTCSSGSELDLSNNKISYFYDLSRFPNLGTLSIVSNEHSYGKIFTLSVVSNEYAHEESVYRNRGCGSILIYY